MGCILAGDLGGTKCRFALVTPDHEVLAPHQIATPSSGEALLAELERYASGPAAEQVAGDPALTPTAVGLGCAGIVHGDGRGIRAANNLPLAGLDLRAAIADRLALPATVLNDGQASALGEHVRGHAAGADPLLVLFFGTGIGFGMVVHGAPYPGFSNSAGEAGHGFYRESHYTCSCGRNDCYEAFCGGKALLARASEVLGPGFDGSPRNGLLSAAVADPRMASILDEAADAAVAMVNNLVHVLNPEAVVLGGGVFDAWPDLGTRIESGVRTRCQEWVTEGLRFHPSLGGSDAVLRGAAAHARATL